MRRWDLTQGCRRHIGNWTEPLRPVPGRGRTWLGATCEANHQPSCRSSVTFIYAGIQKLSDPGYLHPGAPTYIGTQLHGFANGTPGGFLLRTFALPQPKLAGVGVALLEIVIGVLVTAGLLTRLAAAAGLGLNFVLFLTNSWNAFPYFLGSDIVFVFAWLPFVLTGATGQPALDTMLAARERRPRRGGEPVVSRREVLVRAVGLAGAASLGIGALSALAKGSYHGRRSLASLAKPKAAAPPAHATPPPPHQAALPQGAVRLGPANRLPRGQGGTYRDPGDGSPELPPNPPRSSPLYRRLPPPPAPPWPPGAAAPPGRSLATTSPGRGCPAPPPPSRPPPPAVVVGGFPPCAVAAGFCAGPAFCTRPTRRSSPPAACAPGGQ